MKLETVLVKHPTLKFVVINRADFNPKQHELFEGSVAVPTQEAAPTDEPQEGEPLSPDAIKARLQSLSIADLVNALLDAPDLAAVALAEQAENERQGGPRKGALKAIADRRAEFEAQA